MVKDLLPSDPATVGPYRLLGRLGQGGMGTVYLARSPGGRLVAVKVIRPELAGEPGFRTRFAREVRSAREVSGMFTALVVDSDPEGPMPWLATAYVPGPSLAEAVEEHGPLPVDSLLSLFAGLAEGLHAIHSTRLIHRDLKPSNVLLADDGPRVIDFGISRALEDSMLTHTGTIMGTPGFLSPEQAEGRTVGPPSDVFSLGAVLVFAATGDGPFGGGPATALLYRVVNLDPDLSGVPAQVRPIVQSCLAKDPANRPTTAELLDEVGSRVGVVSTDWLPEQFTMTIARYVPTSRTPVTPSVSPLPSRPATPEPAVAGGVTPEAADAAGAALAADPAVLTPAGVEASSAVDAHATPATPATPLPGVGEPVVVEAAIAGAAVAGATVMDPVAGAGPVAAGPAPVTAISDTRADALHTPRPADMMTDLGRGAAFAGAAGGTTQVPPGNDQLTQDARVANPFLLSTPAVRTAAGAGSTAPPPTAPAPGGPGWGGAGVPPDKHPWRQRRRLILAAAAAIIVLAGIGAGVGLASSGHNTASPGKTPSFATNSTVTTKATTARPSHSPSPSHPHTTKPAVVKHPKKPKPKPTPSPAAQYTPTSSPTQVITTSAPPPTTTSAPPPTTHSPPPGPQSISGYSGVSPYGCGAEESPTGGSATSFTVNNQSGSNVQLYYYTASGGLNGGGSVPPNSSRPVSTTTGVFWMVANASGSCLNVFAIQGGGSVTVA
jgi:eukaryotic-like serine/threonine-protein kinase